LHQKQLAYALGYPLHWRVERSVRNEDNKTIIQDRIWASSSSSSSSSSSDNKKKKAYMWMNHKAARIAAKEFVKTGELPETSHLLPPTAKFQKDDKVQVKYEGIWFPAQVLKRRKVGESFLYSVLYIEEQATQDNIPEEDLRTAQDPSVLAQAEGFPQGWTAVHRGRRTMYTSPAGENFANKQAALRHVEEALQAQGDPPWRKEGHDFIGRQVLYTVEHQVSARRTISVDQVGTIVGYIDKADTDRQGNPGFVSTKTDQPANLFHVTFPDDPSHPYAQYLVTEQDLEDDEVEECLIAEDGTEPAAKRHKKALYD
jgi:hypothetical protein